MLEHIKLMLRYLELHQYVIPSYDLKFPHDDLGMRGMFRPERTWRIDKNGLLSYEGSGNMNHRIWEPAIARPGIVPISPTYDAYIYNAHKFLTYDIEKILKRHASSSDIPNIETIIKRFHRLEFML